MADEKKKATESTENETEKVTKGDEKVIDVDGKDGKKNDDNKANNKAKAEEQDESSEEEEKPGIYDKPLVIDGKRKRKKTEFLVKYQQEVKKEPQRLVFHGKGESLGTMEVVHHEISKCAPLELKPLHKLLFGRDGKTLEIKRNIRSFNGFNFEEGSEQYKNKKFMLERFTNEGLKRLLEILDLEKKGTREDLKDRVYTFLMSPKGSGRSIKKNTKKKLSKKTTKRQKSKDKGEKRKRISKPKKSSEVSEEDKDSSEDEEPPVKKSKIKDKVPVKQKASSVKSIPTTPTAKAKKEPVKQAHKKEVKKADKKETKRTPKKIKPVHVAVKITPGKRSPKKSPKKVEKHVEDSESSSDDEPLAKKILKKQPPTSEDLAALVKELLDGADLDKVTVKSIIKQVFAKYPEFDLSDRKAFIKETVYLVISGEAD